MVELGGLSAIEGSDAYVAVRFELASLSKAEDGAKIADEMSTNVKKATDIDSLLSNMLSAAQDAQDHLLCAAYILGKLPVQDKDYRTASRILISTYNRRVDQMKRLINKTKQQLVGSPSPESNAVRLRRAEEQAELDRQQRKVTQDTFDAIAYSMLLSVDTSDNASKTTEYMKFSCGERQDILDRSKELEAGNPDDFQSSARIIFDAVNSHKCR